MAVGSIAKFLKELNKCECSPGHIRFYRGHARVGWKLQPSLFRTEYVHLDSKESALIKELNIHYPDVFRGCENLFENLVVAQHYGIPTRLLDITSNPLVALYFAIANKNKNTGNSEVLIIDVPAEAIVYYDNEKMLETLRDSIDAKKSVQDHTVVCVKARLNNPRIIRQNGAFLFFPNSDNTDEVIPRSLYHIEISNSHISQVKRELADLGITSQSLFPELTQYAEGLKNGEIKL